MVLIFAGNVLSKIGVLKPSLFLSHSFAMARIKCLVCFAPVFVEKLGKVHTETYIAHLLVELETFAL